MKQIGVNMNKKYILISGVALLLLFLVGCETVQQTPKVAPKITINYSIPTIVPVDSAKVSQTKEGIRMSVVPYSHGAQTLYHRQYRAVRAIIISNDRWPADRRMVPYVVISPKNMRFKIKIHNNQERVLRLAGTVIQFQAAGKTVPLDGVNYASFLKGIILPRQEKEFDIIGPPITSIPNNATIALFLYDIVTKTDDAGNPTKRSNFSYYFKLNKTAKSKTLDIKIERRYLTPAAINIVQSRQGGTNKWVSVPEIK